MRVYTRVVIRASVFQGVTRVFRQSGFSGFRLSRFRMHVEFGGAGFEARGFKDLGGGGLSFEDVSGFHREAWPQSDPKIGIGTVTSFPSSPQYP